MVNLLLEAWAFSLERAGWFCRNDPDKVVGTEPLEQGSWNWAIGTWQLCRGDRGKDGDDAGTREHALWTVIE